MSSFTKLNKFVFTIIALSIMLIGCSSPDKRENLAKEAEVLPPQNTDRTDMHCAGLSHLKKGMAYEEVGKYVPELVAFPCRSGANNTVRFSHVEAMFDDSCKLTALKSNTTCTVNAVNRGMELLRKKWARSKDKTKQ